MKLTSKFTSGWPGAGKAAKGVRRHAHGKRESLSRVVLGSDLRVTGRSLPGAVPNGTTWLRVPELLHPRFTLPGLAVLI
jgi:hypothetical protein